MAWRPGWTPRCGRRWWRRPHLGSARVGVFQCSYNTFPGWLARSPLAMLSQEPALRAGGVASSSLIRTASRHLSAFLGSAADPLPLGVALPGLATALEGMPGAAGDSYLEGEFHAALAINQTFRRDLFARGVCPPAPAWRRQALADLQLVLRSGTWPEDGGFDTSLGRMGIAPVFCGALRQTLATAPLSLGELAAQVGEPLESLLPRLAVLLHSGRVSLAGIPGRTEADLASNQAAATAFNERALARITTGAPLDWLLSPRRLQPVPSSLVQAFYLPLLDQGMAAKEVVQLVWMGLGFIGGNFRATAKAGSWRIPPR